ncbi:TIGR03790 family protein [Rhodoferax sp.]|uniref:TIGR03790 family protein n=1 Tax=Rhodoferax sp. TaxID=50421 RepID=UPI002619A3D1|nr:TIGR03790 family protein [Rhodoferax sp.]MDD5479294.1 TIGR03790 family protein [Rhodoferax sp.]
MMNASLFGLKCSALLFCALMWCIGMAQGEEAHSSNALPASAPTLAASSTPADSPVLGASAAQADVRRRWVSVPRIQGKLTAADLGVVINTADPYSVAVGNYYVAKRGVPQAQVLRVVLPVQKSLSAAEFERLNIQIKAHMAPHVQALALAWSQPFAVQCNGITAAVTLGLDLQACQNTCAASKPSRYFNSPSARPYTDLGLRPSMLLAARTISSAKAMIDRGVAADGQLGKLGGLPANAVFVSTADSARNVRAPLFPPPGGLPRRAIAAQLINTDATPNLSRVFLLQTGLPNPDVLAPTQWLPGALADHLTSFGGQLLGGLGQMSVLDWLESGATASYGTVSEPCNHLQKFPHPQVLLLNYVQGSTALEAYWRSVAWPTLGVFVGEPLAAPF